MPHRRRLLEILHRYGARHPTEAATAAAFTDFVREHPDCCARELACGHLTGSAWVLDAAGERVLLLHHRRLGRWLQPGGHADGQCDLAAVAQRELAEETGLDAPRLLAAEPFDLDRHEIPSRPGHPAHHHYDIRWLMQAPAGFVPRLAPTEATDVAWVPLAEVAGYNPEPSLERLVVKILGRWW